MELFEFQKRGLSNDDVFECSNCDDIFQCFTSYGETQFCPSCGARADRFEALSDIDELDSNKRNNRLISKETIKKWKN